MKSFLADAEPELRSLWQRVLLSCTALATDKWDGQTARSILLIFLADSASKFP